MPPDTALTLPLWFAVLMLVGIGLAFVLMSIPYDEPKVKITVKPSPLYERFQKRSKEMQQAKLSAVSKDWRRSHRGSGDAA